MSRDTDVFSELSADDLRAAVRAVLIDVLPDAVTHTPPGETSDGSDSVSLHTDADLNAFVQRLAELCESPAQRAALRSGHRRFRLLAPRAAAAPEALAAVTKSPAHRIEYGAVTERAVKAAATDGVRLILGRRAVMTPLARDRARMLGVEIEKER